MKRREAISVLKEIIEKCQMCDGNWVALMPPNSASLLSKGYQIHLKFPVDKTAVNCIKEVLEKYKLVLIDKRENELLIIYRPKT